jgi:predicted transcriptional regulator
MMESELGAVYVKIAEACNGIKELERLMDKAFPDYLKAQQDASDNGVQFSLAMTEPVLTALNAYKKALDKTDRRAWRNEPTLREQAEAEASI